MPLGEPRALPWGSVVARRHTCGLRAPHPRGERVGRGTGQLLAAQGSSWQRRAAPGSAGQRSTGQRRAAQGRGPCPTLGPQPRARAGGARGCSRTCRARGLRGQLGGVAGGRGAPRDGGQMRGCFPRGMEIWGVLRLVPAEAGPPVTALRGRRQIGFWVGARKGAAQTSGADGVPTPAEGLSAAGPPGNRCRSPAGFGRGV